MERGGSTPWHGGGCYFCKYGGEGSFIINFAKGAISVENSFALQQEQVADQNHVPHSKQSYRLFCHFWERNNKSSPLVSEMIEMTPLPCSSCAASHLPRYRCVTATCRAPSLRQECAYPRCHVRMPSYRLSWTGSATGGLPCTGTADGGCRTRGPQMVVASHGDHGREHVSSVNMSRCNFCYFICKGLDSLFSFKKRLNRPKTPQNTHTMFQSSLT